MPHKYGHINMAGLGRSECYYGSAASVWHHDYMDREKAMTELLDAVSDASPERREQRVLRVAAALYEADKAGARQAELVRRTGYNRETIRRHIEDEKIRRGEIEPTPRYLAEQEKRVKRVAARDS
jgi:hypothetical protein